MLTIYESQQPGKLVANIYAIPIVLVEAAIMLPHKPKGIELLQSQGLSEEEAEALYQAAIDNSAGKLRNYAISGNPFTEVVTPTATTMAGILQDNQVQVPFTGEILHVQDGQEEYTVEVLDRAYSTWYAKMAPMLTQAFNDGVAKGAK